MSQRFTRLSGVALLCAFGLLGGCTEDVDSDAIRTRGMHAIFTAEATGNGNTVVTAQLRVGGNNGTIVKLSSADKLTGKVGTEEKELGAIESRERYRATFTGDAADTLITIDFTRGEDDDDALGSQASLPAPFALSLDGLSPGAAIARGQAVSLKVEPAATGQLAWSVDGSCIWRESGTLADNGTITIPADKVEATGTGMGKACEVTVVVERINSGATATEFKEGGSFRAIQRRSVAFSSTPSPSEAGSGGTGGTGGSSSGGSSSGGSSSGGTPNNEAGAGGANAAGTAGAG